MLSRLRQSDAKGIGTVQCSLTDISNNVTKWSVSSVDLGETKSIFDEATLVEITKKTKLGEFVIRRQKTSEPRTIAKFRPVRIASVIKGNTVYDGKVDISFSVPNLFKEVKVLGPLASLAKHDQSSCPYLPPISAVSYPQVYMPRAQWCLQQAANKASEAVHNFGMTLGELAETVSMLTNPLKSIYRLSSRMNLVGSTLFLERRGKSRQLMIRPSLAVKKFAAKTGMEKARDAHLAGCYVVNESSNFWLTYRFGISPFVKEVSDIMSMNYSDYESSPLQLARKKVTDEWTIKNGSATVSLGYRMFANIDDIVRYRSSSAATYAYSVKHGIGLSDFLNSTGMSLRHIPQVLWELVPCSFVLDRFVDVGSFIKALTPDPNVKTVDTCVSEKVEILLTRKVSSVYRLYYDVKNYKASVNRKLRIWNTRYSRDVGTPVPILPQFNPKLLKIAQNIDHVTLIWQRLPKWR